jgi:peptide deformylase
MQPSRPPPSLRPILEVGDPCLRQPATAVDPATLADPATQDLIDDVVATMRAAHGAGLAATQVGVGLRICAIEVDHNPRYPYKPPIPLTVLVNPEVRPLTDERFENNEGCLSVPNLRGSVLRFTEVSVTAIDRFGDRLEFDVRGLSAGTFQHECDHLDGVLFLDRVTDPATIATWENFERYHRPAYLGRVAALVARYGQ